MTRAASPRRPIPSCRRARRFRPHACSLQSFVWEIPVREQEQRVCARGARRLAVVGHARGANGHAHQLHLQRNDAARALSTRNARTSSGRPKVFGKIRTGRTLLRYVGLLRAARRRAGFAPFGNMKRHDSINGPGYVNLDGSIFKRFRFTERFGGELRADVFNVTNSPHFNNPEAVTSYRPLGRPYRSRQRLRPGHWRVRSNGWCASARESLSDRS